MRNAGMLHVAFYSYDPSGGGFSVPRFLKKIPEVFDRDPGSLGIHHISDINRSTIRRQGTWFATDHAAS